MERLTVCALTACYKSGTACWTIFSYRNTLSCPVTLNGRRTTEQTGFSTTRNNFKFISTTSTLPHVVVNAWILSSHEEGTESVWYWIDWFSLLEISCKRVCQLWKSRFMRYLSLNLCWLIIAGIPTRVIGETFQWRFVITFCQRKMEAKKT